MASNKINQALSCVSQKNAKSTTHPLYQDLYGDHVGVKELKMRDFRYQESTKTLTIRENLQRGIIIFYAPWCTHCNNAFDDIVELSVTYSNVFPIMVVNIEDLKNHNDELTRYAKVKKYPSVRVINMRGVVEDVSLSLTKDNIHYYINMNL